MEFEILKECERLLGEEIDSLKIALMRDDLIAITIEKNYTAAKIMVDRAYMKLDLAELSERILQPMVESLRDELKRKASKLPMQDMGAI